jgi:hypothetical protein
MNRNNQKRKEETPEKRKAERGKAEAFKMAAQSAGNLVSDFRFGFGFRFSMLCALAACLTLSACQRQIKDTNLAAVKSDMTTKEVESVLGPPSRVETPTELKSQEVVTMKVTRYVYEQNGKKVELLFVGDRLATGGVNGSFEK